MARRPAAAGISVDRATFKHAAVYSAAAVVGRMAGFILLPMYAHVLRDLGYGVIGMIEAALGLLMALLAQGIHGSLVRFYHEEEGAAKLRVISTGTILIGVATLAMIGLVALVARPVSSLLLGDPDLSVLMLLGLGVFFFDMVGHSAGTILVIQRRSLLYSSVSLLQLAIGIALNVYFLLVLEMGLLGYFLAALLGSIVPTAVHLGIALRICGIGFDRRIARKLIAFQLPLVPGALASYVSRQFERILVRFMIALEGVGVLEMGYKFPTMLTVLIHGPFMRSWDTGRFQIAEEPDAPARIGRMFTYAMFLMLAGGLIMAVCIEDLLKVLTPPEFWYAHRIAQVEIVTTLLMAASFHLNFGLFYAKQTKVLAMIRGVTSVVKVGVSYVCIYLWGLRGAAYSAAIVAAIMMLWTHHRSQRLYRLKVQHGRLLVLIGVALAIFLALNFVHFDRLAGVRALAQRHLPEWTASLSDTFLGQWKEGKALRLLEEKALPLVDMIVKGLLACLYFALFPLVHDGTRLKLRRRWDRLRRRGGGAG